MKSNAIWLQEGDQTTTYVHKKVVAHKFFNSIQCIIDHRGTLCENFGSIITIEISYYKKLYNQLMSETLRSVLLVPNAFPNLINEETN